MAVTRRDFEQIAQIIKLASDLKFSDSNKAIEAIANQLAAKFKSDNPRFDRERFLRACGLGQAEVKSV